MNDEFSVDESGMTSDGYHRLLPVSKRAMYLRNAIRFVVVTVAIGVAIHYGDLLFGTMRDLCCAGLIILYIVVAAYLCVAPLVFYKRYRYRMDDDKVEIRRGIITITHTLVPIERIHQVEVARGPINRRFGLANVVMTTAGGVSTLEYLDLETAEQIASKLNETVVRLLKARD
jgi:hypothetical protein